jgi:hypothetical protein
MQYCSLNNPDPFGGIDAARALALARPKFVVAHFALHSAEVDAVSAGDDPLLEDLPQNRFMQGFPAPRGK